MRFLFRFHPGYLESVLRIQMFLGILDPDPLVRDTDPAPDPSIKQKIVSKTLITTVLSLLFDFLSLKNDVNVP